MKQVMEVDIIALEQIQQQSLLMQNHYQKVSTANSTSSMNYKEGTLWNFITQPQAALVSQNMYKKMIVM